MRKIMENTQEHFVNLELNSEIAVSTGVAATAMQKGYSGIVNISPFACLIGRVIEGLFAPWARDRNYPTISVEVDGNLLPPNLVNKLNIFMVNVLRFRGGSDVSGLIDGAGQGTGQGAGGNGNGDGQRRVVNAVPLSVKNVDIQALGEDLNPIGSDGNAGCAGCSGCDL